MQPHPQTLAREIEAFRVAAAGTPAPRLEVHRLLMADSGTLLLCSVDHTGHLAQVCGGCGAVRGGSRWWGGLLQMDAGPSGPSHMACGG